VGFIPVPGAIHHDRIKHADHIDVAWDLNILPWPWQDEEFNKVIAIDVLEHLKPWKVDIQGKPGLTNYGAYLKPGGLAALHLPAWDQPLSYRDPTHYRVFHEQSFSTGMPGHMLHEQFGKFYFAESNRWWQVELIERQGNSDIGYVLRKLVS
jgi:cyclopropane fatty-acyl-phospholipid synthase-like methyltransferase